MLKESQELIEQLRFREMPTVNGLHHGLMERIPTRLGSSPRANLRESLTVGRS